MMTLIMAAAVATQSAPPAKVQGPMPMSAEQHQAMKKEGCCCDEMAKGEHDKHAHEGRTEHGE